MVLTVCVKSDNADRNLQRLKLNSPVHQDALIGANRFGTTKYTTAYTVGCFDLFHAGHIRLLERMRKRASRVIVGVHDGEK